MSHHTVLSALLCCTLDLSYSGWIPEFLEKVDNDGSCTGVWWAAAHSISDSAYKVRSLSRESFYCCSVHLAFAASSLKCRSCSSRSGNFPSSSTRSSCVWLIWGSFCIFYLSFSTHAMKSEGCRFCHEFTESSPSCQFCSNRCINSPSSSIFKSPSSCVWMNLSSVKIRRRRN